MLFGFNLHKVMAHKISDGSIFDPFNTKCEFYQTWQLCNVEDLESGNTVPWAKQGFSFLGAPNDGVTFGKNEERQINDLNIVINLPELKENEKKIFRLNVHWWESDSSTLKVREAFTDSTLKVLMKAFISANQNANQAKDELEKWLKDNANELAKTVVRITKSENEQRGLTVAKLLETDVIQLFGLIVDLLRNNSDDYLWQHVFTFTISRENGNHEIVISDNNNNNIIRYTFSNNYTQAITIRSANGDNSIDLEATYHCRVY